MIATVVPIRLSLSNAYLVKGQQAILVDTGSPGEANAILQVLERERVNPHSLSLLLHTHGHSDHAGSTHELRRLTGAPVAVHAADAALLRTGRNGPLPPTRLEARLVKPFVDRPFPAVDPDITFDHELDLSPYGIDGSVLLTPGHTAGSISVLLDGGEAIVGDVMMGGFMGGRLLPSRPAYHYFAEDLPAVRDSIRQLIHLNPPSSTWATAALCSWPMSRPISPSKEFCHESHRPQRCPARR
jgi:hydroxyacylglutathione hydrolase